MAEPEPVEERLNQVDRELERLERKMDDGFKAFRKDMDRILDGTPEEPGILRKLDRLDDIARLLEERLPPPPKDPEA